jgi:hypothetical protein
MICGAALARPTTTVSTKSFETSSQKLNNSGISAHPTLRTIKKVNRMEALFTDCLSMGSFRSQFVRGLVKSNPLPLPPAIYLVNINITMGVLGARYPPFPGSNAVAVHSQGVYPVVPVPVPQAECLAT